MIARPGGKPGFVLLGWGSTPGNPPPVYTPEALVRWAQTKSERDDLE
jgi:hypothetical protein